MIARACKERVHEQGVIMSRHQIAQFSAFLMSWISEPANNHILSEAILHAFAEYTKERDSLLGDSFESSTADEATPQESLDQNADGFQYFLNQAKKIAGQAGAVAKTVASSAYSHAMDYATSNSVVFFQDACPSPDPKKFLLSVDARQGTWEVDTDGYLLKRTSLKTRMIAEVTRAYIASRRILLTPDMGEVDAELNSVMVPVEPEKCLLTAVDKVFSKLEHNEMKILKLLLEGAIDPLTKPNQALLIYQSLLAIDMHQSLKSICEESAIADSKKVTLPQPPPRLQRGAAPAAIGDDDGCAGQPIPSDNRSTVGFK